MAASLQLNNHKTFYEQEQLMFEFLLAGRKNNAALQ